MKIIKSSVKILDNDWSVKGIFRAIERAGRTCYKSVGTRYFRLVEEPENSLKSNVLVLWTSYSLLETQKSLELIVFFLYVLFFA